MTSDNKLKLFMLLLGSKAPGRHVEQHDFFFGIATSLKDLLPDMKSFWPEAGNSLHIDGWREVSVVDNHRVVISLKGEEPEVRSNKKIFFINLGGYQESKLEEQHYTVLTVQADRASASNEAKKSVFYKHNTIKGSELHKGATSHIDDKYGIDVDDVYQIEEILSPQQKELYRIDLVEVQDLKEDPIHLGYLKLSSFK